MEGPTYLVDQCCVQICCPRFIHNDGEAGQRHAAADSNDNWSASAKFQQLVAAVRLPSKLECILIIQQSQEYAGDALSRVQSVCHTACAYLSVCIKDLSGLR